MKTSFRPLYNKVIHRKHLFTEKNIDTDEIWDGHYILEFNPYDNKKSCQLLVSSVYNKFPVDLIHWGNNEFCSFKIQVLDDLGAGDSSEFIEWIDCFYNHKNNYYNFNIYDNDAKDVNIFLISKSLKKLSRFRLYSCVIKNPIFFEYNKNNHLSPQLALTLCTKHSIVINQIN